MKKPASPLPWYVQDGGKSDEDGAFYIKDAKDNEVADIDSYSSENDEKDAAFIVLAVNSYEKFRKALIWYAGNLRPEDRLTDNGDKAVDALKRTP